MTFIWIAFVFVVPASHFYIPKGTDSKGTLGSANRSDTGPAILLDRCIEVAMVPHAVEVDVAIPMVLQTKRVMRRDLVKLPMMETTGGTVKQLVVLSNKVRIHLRIPTHGLLAYR